MSDYPTKKYYLRNKRFIRRVKSLAEYDECGYDAHPAALEFHHVDAEEKRFRVGDPGTYSIETIKEEMRKCKILCANCHNILHDDD
jgi:tetrahydromethanopterin S-methyltransferase subunit A